MRKVKLFQFTIYLTLAFILIFSWLSVAWGHGEGTRIVPESLSVKSGSELKVTVNGLVDTKTAIFHLTGLSGKYKLGEFPISSDDFTQVLKIPADAPPGSYRLTVEGGGKSAKVVITVN
jgi:hypothetical protein